MANNTTPFQAPKVLGCTGTLLIEGNEITLIGMGDDAVTTLSASPTPGTPEDKQNSRTASVFERIILAENVLEGPGSCLIGQHIVINGNVFSRVADWSGFFSAAVSNLPQTTKIGDTEVSVSALVIARDMTITGNQATHPATGIGPLFPVLGDVEVDLICAVTGRYGSALEEYDAFKLMELTSMAQNGSLLPVWLCQVPESLRDNA